MMFDILMFVLSILSTFVVSYYILSGGKNVLTEVLWRTDMTQLRILQKQGQELFMIQAMRQPRVSVGNLLKPYWHEVRTFETIRTIFQAEQWIRMCHRDREREAAPWVEVK